VIASLPMYDFPDCRDANDRYWALIRDGLRAAGIGAPEALTRGAPDLLAHWQQSDLVLSQTCGFPFRSVLADRVTLIGTADFGVEGCPPGYYQSVLVVRGDDPRDELVAYNGARFAYNDPMSQSGWAAAQTQALGLGFALNPAVKTGAHALSARAVLEGRADMASIDAVTWRLLQRNDPDMAALRVVARTDPTPGLPYIAALGVNHRLGFDAISGAIAALTEQDRATLGIKRLLFIPAAAYLAVPSPAAPAQFAH
jgi:ABC-type phosphate/phosphonate transport system substrate-binding protein